MSGKTLVDQIKHYQKDIERCPENSERMIRCIQRLYVLPIQVLHLQETGVGRSVNSLRKYKGEVGEAAKALVAKWKAMVAAEESSDDSNDKVKTKSPDSKLNKSSISTVKVEPKSEKPVVKVEPKPEKLIVKTEAKLEKLDNPINRDKHSSKDRSSTKEKCNKDKSSNKEKPIKSYHESSRYHSESHTSKSHSSSLKRSYSGTEKNHSSNKRSNSFKNHKSQNEKRPRSDDEESPNSKKHKKYSYSRNLSHSKKDIVESEDTDEEVTEETQDEEMDSDQSESGNSGSNSEKESSEDSENSSSDEEDSKMLIEGQKEEEENDEKGSDSSPSDQRHHSRHKSSHHRHKKSSHSHSVKNKENHKGHTSSSKHSSKKSVSKSSPKNLEELIKENEKKIKKEKDDFDVPKYVPTKTVKLERNEDGSIDGGSGASFADALLGVDNYLGQKKKKKSISSKETYSSQKTSSQKSSNSNSSSHKSHSHSNSSTNKEKSKDNSSSKPKTIDELVETPELLTKKVKLEALDLDISSTLPEINPNYKPLPHIPESSRRHMKTMSEEDTMFSIMTTKNQRTKVYSGNKVYQNSVPSLFKLCIQLLYENIDAVEYTGGVPYNLLKPLLERLNSDQLYVIEHFNPYLIEDTDDLWKFHCNKDFRSESRHDMESWRDLYLRCIEERERKLKALTANISQSMAKSTPVRQAKLAYVDSVVKPPRNVARKQAKYGTGSATSSLKSSTPSNNKQDIVNKAIVGGHTPGVSAKDVVPPPPVPRAVHHATPAILKKKKAPLMQKALQFIKGNRYKR